jgi:indole-3-glycerol phosphate synthase
MSAAASDMPRSSSSDSDSDSESERSSSSNNNSIRPMAFSSGFSTLPDLREAIREAVAMAVSGLPPPPRSQDGEAITTDIDVGWVSITSLYDGGTHSPATTVIPVLLSALTNDHHRQIEHIIGSSSAGCISSAPRSLAGATAPPSGATPDPSRGESAASASTAAACRPVEFDGVPAVSVTLAVLPDVVADSFCVASSDVPDGDFPQYVSAAEWRRAVGLSSRLVSPREVEAVSGIPDPPDPNASPVFYLLPSPAFAADLDALVAGMEHYYPRCQVVGGVASTVSSLSRAKLYQWSRARHGVGAASAAASSNKDANDSGGGATTGTQSFTCVADGCVGLALRGDVAIRQMMALGAKPVGGIYQVLKASGSTISVIVLDEVATNALQLPAENEEEEEKEEDDGPDSDGAGDNSDDAAASARGQMAQFYAKAQIPKPVLAEANFLMRTLSDDDQAFMRRQLLVGLEQGGGLGRTASELARLAAGQGHRFAIHPVASAGMKDGSVTLPLGTVNVQPGTRLRFFVRESDFAKKEINALWAGYMKRALDDQFKPKRDDGTPIEEFKPAACFIIPTLDRGTKFFLGKPGYEGSTVARRLPGITSISGFFSNGVVGRIEGVVPPPNTTPSAIAAATNSALYKTGVQGSASGYILWGPRSGRPVYSPAQAAAEAAARKEAKAAEEREAQLLAAEDARRVLLSAQRSSGSLLLEDRAAPRSADGELVLKRREVHSGRALTVSTVEWSVAEKIAKPSSALEGFMWEKETEVDRFRERVPLANLVSQCRQSLTDPTAPKPRDWAGPVMRAVANRGFAIIPECKRMEPTTGSLRRRYDVSKLAREYTLAGVPAQSVNCDAVLFGGTLDDVTRARQAASSAAVEAQAVSSSSIDDDGVVVPPILASDLILYPYQLYKLRLAGADAVNLVAGALARKDLVYLTKIASSLQLQTLVSVTSHVQIRSLMDLPIGSYQGLIVSNRELEDFSFDMTGEQALALLRGDALVDLRAKVGRNFPVLVEGRVGIIERPDPSSGTKSARRYLEELREAGAMGAIVGGGLATSGRAAEEDLESLALPLATS